MLNTFKSIAKKLNAKLFLIAMLCFVMVLSLVGCGGDSADPQPPQQKNNLYITVNISDGQSIAAGSKLVLNVLSSPLKPADNPQQAGKYSVKDLISDNNIYTIKYYSTLDRLKNNNKYNQN